MLSRLVYFGGPFVHENGSKAAPRFKRSQLSLYGIRCCIKHRLDGNLPQIFHRALRLSHLQWVTSFKPKGITETLLAKCFYRLRKDYSNTLNLNQWESLRFSENSLNFSHYSTTEKNQWCYIDWDSVHFHWISETFTDSNLQWNIFWCREINSWYIDISIFFLAQEYFSCSRPDGGGIR